MMRFEELTNYLNEVIVPLIDTTGKYFTDTELKKASKLYNQAEAVVDKEGPVTSQDVEELDKIISEFNKVIPQSDVVNDRNQKVVLYQKTLEKD